MKYFVALVFVLLSLSASAQKADTVTQVVKLTEWQEKQMLAFEEQKKRLDEQAKLLWLAILDANKVDPNKIVKVDYRPGELVIKTKKQ